MLKTLLATAVVGLALAAPTAQALEARPLAAPAVATAGASVELQLVGNRGDWGRDRGHRWGRHQRLDVRQVVNRLHRHGYTRVRAVQPRGNVFVAKAFSRRGGMQRLVVDAYSGDIVGRTAIRPRRGW